jgi:hypothetical protein
LPGFRITLTCLIFGFFLSVAGAAGASSALPSHFMPSSQVEVGMSLVGKTCFRGTEIEEFTGTVIGVEHGAFAGKNLIWAELEGPRLGAHGVVGGMSGSPCYIDGRLIGAVAYGYSWSQTPIAGITPIESMFEVFKLTDERPHAEEDAWLDGGLSAGVWDIEELEQMARGVRTTRVAPLRLAVRDLPEALRESAPRGAESVEIEPLSISIGTSPCSPRVYAPLAEFLAERGMTLAPGMLSGGTLDGASLPPFEAGSALGMPMMTGDLTIGGYGTVTYVEGNRLIAFGHPAFGWGNVDIPMAPCRMFAVQPSYSRSNKMGEVATPVGAIRQDRQPGIGGVVGPVPRQIPLRVRVRASETGQDREFRYLVWDHRLFVAQLVLTGFLEALDSAARLGGKASVETEYSIRIEGAPPIRKRIFASDTSGAFAPAASRLNGDLALLTLNPFRGAKIESVEADIRITPGVRFATLVSVHPDKDVYRPGDTVRLGLVIQPYRGPREKRTVDFPLPDDLHDGLYSLFVGNSTARLLLEKSRAPGLFTPADYDQLIEAIRRHFASDKIYIVLQEPAGGLTVHGQELPALPPSLRSALADSGERAFIRSTSGRFLAEQAVAGETEFTGSAKLSLRVDRSGRR